MAELDLKAALQQWANNLNIEPPAFAAVMGYTYNHAWQVLRGQADVTEGTLGRVALRYGVDDLESILRIASELPQPAEQ